MQNEDRSFWIRTVYRIWLPCHVFMKWSIQKHDSQQKFFELAKHLKTDFDVNSKFIINK